MREINSVKNSISAIFANIISFVIAFLAQAVFIRLLGAEYLGLNGLFTNILSMLSIFELGIGNAIVYNMYKPLATKDTKKINSLMLFYKKAYRYIAIIIFSFGILLMPFIKYIVGDITIDVNIYIVYLLFLVSTVTSYFMVYKRNLIIASQKNYIINIIHMIYLIILNICQLLIIYITKNFYLYLVIKIICQLLENVIITYLVNKKFSFLNINDAEKLDKNTEKDIFSRVKALIFHKIGAISINGTDNIIISSFLGVIQVGIYSNYYIIINAINTIFGQAISSTTASVGNLIITESKDKIFDTFKKIRFLNFWIASFSGICLLVIFQPFIEIWVGKEYLLTMPTVSLLVFNYYQKMMRNSYTTFKDSAGIWKEDKFVPIVESIINIFFSILCLKFFGISGVFMGTIISGLTLWCYSYPKFIYKNLFGKSYYEYAKETTAYIMLFIILSFITYFVSTLFFIQNLILKIFVNLIICIIIPNTILIIIFRKTENFVYFKKLSIKIFMRIVKLNAKDVKQ